MPAIETAVIGTMCQKGVFVEKYIAVAKKIITPNVLASDCNTKIKATTPNIAKKGIIVVLLKTFFSTLCAYQTET